MVKKKNKLWNMTSLVGLLNLIYDVQSYVKKHKALQHIIQSTSLIESDFEENQTNNQSIKDSINQLLTPSEDDFEISLPVEQFDPDEIIVKVKGHQIVI